MNKKEQIIKGNKGFTTADVAVAIIIITIFVGMIATIFYNFYLTTTAKNRNAMATNCLIDVIEQVKLIPYDEIDETRVNSLIDALAKDETIPKGYTITVSVQKYNEIEGNEGKEDIIKILNVKAEYTVGNKIEKIDISTLLTK